MKTLKIGIWVLGIVLAVSILTKSALADTKSVDLTLKLEFFDEDMILIEEINEDELTSSYSKHTYPTGTNYIKVTANTDDTADDIEITINGSTYKKYPHKDISTQQQCYITITVTDNTTDKESEFDIQLDRSAVSRDNTITTVSWTIYDGNGDSLPTDDILLLDDGVEYNLPKSVDKISLDYFVTGNEFTQVSVVLENGNIVTGNNEPIMVDTSKKSTTIYIQGQIDDAFTSYSLTFTKAAEESGDSTLTLVEFEGYSATDYFEPATIVINEDVYRYTAIIPDEATKFYVYPYVNHVMASAVCSAEGVSVDENGLLFFPIGDEGTQILIEVTAENNEISIYNIFVVKEQTNQQQSTSNVTPVEETKGFFIDNIWIIIPIIVILIAIVVLVFMQVRKNKYY